MTGRGVTAITVIAAGLLAARAAAQNDFDWVTIGDPGNESYQGPPDAFGIIAGSGSVGYEYRMSRTEVSTGQWLEFVNAFGTAIPDLVPTHWGATQSAPGLWSLRNDVATPAMLPVGGITWEQAAIYCNWLHNGKQSDIGTLWDGVYDTSTFTFDGHTFTHQLAPKPGARYWIPNLDEWLKAAHYDPDKNGSGQGGWWLYPNSSDTQLVPGLPGVGETMAFIDLPGSAEWDIPLGAYPDVRSPWGLLDLSGGAAEWASTSPLGLMRDIFWEGTYAGSTYDVDDLDRVDWFGTTLPVFPRRNDELQACVTNPCAVRGSHCGAMLAQRKGEAMSKGVITVAVLCALVLGPSAVAQTQGTIYVDKRAGGVWTPADGYTPVTGGTNSLVEFDALPNTDYRIWADSYSSTDIGTIRINGTSEYPVANVFIGKPPTNTYSTTAFILVPGARDIRRYETDIPTRLQLTIVGNFEEVVGAHRIGAFRIDGALNALMIANPVPVGTGDLGHLIIGSVGINAEIRNRRGDTPRIDVVGDMGGLIRVQEGNLGNVDAGGSINSIAVTGNVGLSGAPSTISATASIDSIVVSGDIGTPTEPATITATDGIDLIDCAALYADIDANSGGAGGVTRLITRTGPFVGSLDAEYLGQPGVPNWVNIRTDLDAVISSAGPLTQRMFIGGSLLPDAEINLPTGGLQNVIYVNTFELPGATWAGTVNVGPVVLDAPDYSVPSSALGGKDVAFIRHGLHEVDCVPPDGAVIGGQGSLGADIYEVELSHYGYVMFDDQGPSPLKIEWRSTAPWATGEWTDKTSEYQVVKQGTGLSQVLVVSRIDEAAFPQQSEYRITPAESGGENILMTDGVGDVVQPMPVGDYEYNLRIERHRDLNLNGAVDTPDITAWVENPIDLNADAAANADDLAELVEDVVNGG